MMKGMCEEYLQIGLGNRWIECRDCTFHYPGGILDPNQPYYRMSVLYGWKISLDVYNLGRNVDV